MNHHSGLLGRNNKNGNFFIKKYEWGNQRPRKPTNEKTGEGRGGGGGLEVTLAETQLRSIPNVKGPVKRKIIIDLVVKFSFIT